MQINKVEKIVFSFLFTSLIFGSMLLVVKISGVNSANNYILNKINLTSKQTDRTEIEKTFFFDEKESQSKLNLNRANLSDIKTIPCLNPSLAKRIHSYISEKKQISELKELLDVKGMTNKKLRELDKYATVMGGHAGSAAWGDKLDLNFAKVNELVELPGITQKLAEKIIEFRNSNGGFHSLDDLYEIPGLSEKTIKRFIDLVEVK